MNSAAHVAREVNKHFPYGCADLSDIYLGSLYAKIHWGFFIDVALLFKEKNKKKGNIIQTLLFYVMVEKNWSWSSKNLQWLSR